MSDAVRIPVGKLAAGDRPSSVEIGAAFQAILAGEAEPALMAAFLMALRVRGETTDDIIAGATAMRAAVAARRQMNRAFDADMAQI